MKRLGLADLKRLRLRDWVIALLKIPHLPLDALKIDRAFVAGMTISTEHMAIVSAIINLAKALRIYVVAEGVETEEQAGRLYALGCDEAQGISLQPTAAGRGHLQAPDFPQFVKTRAGEPECLRLRIDPNFM